MKIDTTAISTAAEMKVSNLYRYQPFKPERLIPLLKGKLYCARPRQFNDPWDCRPWFNDTQLDDPEYFERYFRWLEWVDRVRYPKTEDEHQRLFTERRADPDFPSKSIQDISVGMWAEINERYGVCCLSSKPNCTLMWSHYADNHKGICLAFATSNEILCTAFKVKYCAEYPFLDVTNETNGSLLALTCKSDVWRYEDEYRVIGKERKFLDALERKLVDQGDGLAMDDQWLALQKGALKSVILGCSMPEDTRLEVRSLVDELKVDVVIKQTVRIPNHYGLEIVPV